jgi:hypothetical protein
MDRMLGAMGRDRSGVAVIEEEDLPELIREHGWVVDTRQGAYENGQDPDIVFGAFTWPTAQEKARILNSPLCQECLDAFRSGGGPLSSGAAKWTQTSTTRSGPNGSRSTSVGVFTISTARGAACTGAPTARAACSTRSCSMSRNSSYTSTS